MHYSTIFISFLFFVNFNVHNHAFVNCRPDIEEGEKLIRRHNNQSKCADQSLFLNFAMHSVRMEACDCPPTHHVPSEDQSNSSVFPGNTPHIVVQNDDVVQSEGYNCHSDYSQVGQDSLFWGSKKSRRNKSHAPVNKVSQVGEKPRSSMKESEKQRNVGSDSFLRVLFWQFHNFRMLLGSDLLLFSNEKYVAVSLHLWDVTRQVRFIPLKSSPCFMSGKLPIFVFPILIGHTFNLA